MSRVIVGPYYSCKSLKQKEFKKQIYSCVNKQCSKYTMYLSSLYKFCGFCGKELGYITIVEEVSFNVYGFKEKFTGLLQEHECGADFYNIDDVIVYSNKIGARCTEMDDCLLDLNEFQIKNELDLFEKNSDLRSFVDDYYEYIRSGFGVIQLEDY